MILSKFQLDRRDPSIRQALVNCQDMHRNIQKMFSSSRVESNILYRIHVKDRKCELYVLSEQEPPQPITQSGMTLIFQRDMKKWEDNLQINQTFRFDISVCPTKKVKTKPESNSRRRCLHTEEECAEWMHRKGEQQGFDILALNHCGTNTVVGSNENHKILFDVVHYMGYLRITDVNKFIKTLHTGIGPEKAYGAGLLLIS